ncbi:oxidoreductase HTATIP2-like [Watersipora subatra]|uniref:oxidoreductase HTATIP2-like n=1 Tax=Watersipora subatra TaxID=2589382 RepID=UPI00355BD738
MSLKSAFVIGYTGATGKELVKELAKSKRFERVTLIGRRKVEYDDAELQKFEQRVIDYEKLKDLAGEFSGFDVGFCCLGTTRKEAGSAEAFRHVDYDYVHQIGLNCKEGGTKHFHLVSSAGADANSSFLYPQVKGQIESALADMQFERLSIYRPRMLKRSDAARAGEKFFYCLVKPIELISPATVVTPCDLLSRAMIVNCDTTPTASSEIVFNAQIFELDKAGKATSKPGI